MRILALDFSSEQRSVAVLDSEASRVKALSEVIETGGRSTQAFGMIEQALQQARIEREQIDCLAIGLGPGSYTGIRAAISIAQGWQLALGIKVLGLSSADCIAAQAQEEGARGELAVVIDAQRDEFYTGTYTADQNSFINRRPLRLANKGEVDALPAKGILPIGPEVTRWFASGRVVFPRASILARLASRQTEYIPGEKLEPIYLRETRFVKAPPARTWK